MRALLQSDTTQLFHAGPALGGRKLFPVLPVSSWGHCSVLPLPKWSEEGIAECLGVPRPGTPITRVGNSP